MRFCLLNQVYVIEFSAFSIQKWPFISISFNLSDKFVATYALFLGYKLVWKIRGALKWTFWILSKKFILGLPLLSLRKYIIALLQLLCSIHTIVELPCLAVFKCKRYFSLKKIMLPEPGFLLHQRELCPALCTGYTEFGEMGLWQIEMFTPRDECMLQEVFFPTSKFSRQDFWRSSFFAEGLQQAKVSTNWEISKFPVTETSFCLSQQTPPTQTLPLSVSEWVGQW